MASLCLVSSSATPDASKLAELRDKMYKQIDFSKQQFYDQSGKIRDDVFNNWSASQLKAWADSHGLQAPQPSKTDEVVRFARRNKKLLQDDINEYTKRASENATPYINKASDQISQTSKDVSQAGRDFFDASVAKWSDSRLKGFLDARGIQIGPKTSREKLVDLVQKNKNKVIKDTNLGPWSFDAWSTEELQNWLKEQGKKADGQREQLVETAQDYLNRAKDAGSGQYNAIVQSLQNSVDQYKQVSFDKWSDSDLKAYLDTYGVKTYQGSKRNELIAHARSQYRLFTRGADPDGWTRVKDSFVAGGYQLFNSLKAHGSYAYYSAKSKADELYKTYGRKQAPLKFQN